MTPGAGASGVDCVPVPADRLASQGIRRILEWYEIDAE
jgi:hypothetical protein